MFASVGVKFSVKRFNILEEEYVSSSIMSVGEI